MLSLAIQRTATCEGLAALLFKPKQTQPPKEGSGLCAHRETIQATRVDGEHVQIQTEGEGQLHPILGVPTLRRLHECTAELPTAVDFKVMMPNLTTMIPNLTGEGLRLPCRCLFDSVYVQASRSTHNSHNDEDCI